MKYYFLSCFLTFECVIVYLGTTTACALKLFRNCVALEKDPDQVNFIKMRIQGIWDCPDQDQEVGAKHINETEMFQMASREPMEPIDEEGGDLVDLEDAPGSDHIQDSAEETEHVDVAPLSANLGEQPVPDLLME